MADDKPIIIIKKKGGHGGHHGGAWKVAYADFVTAMMAFFMVMWLVNSAEQVTKQNIASYFRKPGIFASGSGTPLLIGEAGILSDGYVPPHPEDTKQRHKGSAANKMKGTSGTEDSAALNKRVSVVGEDGKRGRKTADKDALEGFARIKTVNDDADYELERAAINKKFAEQIQEQLRSIPNLKDILGQVEVKIEADGVNIEIMDTEKVSMFASGSASITAEAQTAFAKIADALSPLPHKLDIIGHTDAKGFSSRPGGYSNWELSADRANAARRLLETKGIQSSRIISVVGRSDKELKIPDNPLAPSNRRITVKMRFDDIPPAASIPGEEEDPPSELDKLFGPSKGRSSRREESSPSEPPQGRRREEPPGGAPAQSGAAEPALPPKLTVSEPNKIKLPDEPAPLMNPGLIERDKIFSESPVFGARREPLEELR